MPRPESNLENMIHNIGQNTPELTKLVLNGDEPTQSEWLALLQALEKNQHINTLEFLHFSFPSLQAILDLASLLNTNSSIHTFTLHGHYILDSNPFCQALASSLANNNSLKRLNLYYLNASSASIVQLAKALETNQTLEYLILERNSCDSACLLALLKLQKINPRIIIDYGTTRPLYQNELDLYHQLNQNRVHHSAKPTNTAAEEKLEQEEADDELSYTILSIPKPVELILNKLEPQIEPNSNTAAASSPDRVTIPDEKPTPKANASSFFRSALSLAQKIPPSIYGGAFLAFALYSLRNANNADSDKGKPSVDKPAQPGL